MKRVALAVCALLLTVVATADAAVPYIIGDHIADFTLNDAYGTPVSLYDFQDMVILLNFWTPT
jgi:cytochrome oxidase Cu insertion factor (SCO1/SenC/PrrC family)